MKSKAILIRLVNYSDSSKIIHFLTEKYGIRHAIVRGLKRKSSKHGGILNMFNEVEITFKEKASSDMIYLDDHELIRSNITISENLQKYYTALFYCELVSKVAQINHEDKDLYNDLSTFLEKIKLLKHQEALLSRFLLSLLTTLGFELNFKYCSNCGTGLDKKYQFTYYEGLLCENCSRDEISNYMTPEVFRCLYTIQEIKLDKIEKISINSKLFLEIVNTILLFIENHIDEKLNLKTLEYLRTL